MKMHTSSHILSAIINQETQALITGNQLEEQESRMDFNAKKIDKETIEKIETKANQIITSNIEIKISFERKEIAMQRPELFKLKDVLPKNIPIFRIVSIGNFDIQADGGTHVKNTKEIGKIKITNFKNKGAENKRIYWQLI